MKKIRIQKFQKIFILFEILNLIQDIMITTFIPNNFERGEVPQILNSVIKSLILEELVKRLFFNSERAKKKK